MKRFKMFTSGLIVGVVITGSITVFANVSAKVEAYLNQTKISLDGKQLVIPSDTAVLNYNDRTYLPSRFVAESLGATVEWDQANDTVKITSPEPKTVIKEVIKEVEKDTSKEEGTTTSTDKRDFLELPVRYATSDYYVEVYKAEVSPNSVELYLKVKNEKDSDISLDLELGSSYVVSDGKKIYADPIGYEWDETIAVEEEREGSLRFENFAAVDNKVEVVIGLETTKFPATARTQKQVRFYIDATEED